ncbi:MAG: VOC family protein [Pseudomonadota bacterium]
MQLGPFSLSLSVRDLGDSLAFYRSLGFEVVDDHRDDNWVVLSNGSARIGLFQGMFPRNVLTFRPTSLDRVIDGLRGNGVEVPDDTFGSHFFLTDPDGNPILVDQVGAELAAQPVGRRRRERELA